MGYPQKNGKAAWEYRAVKNLLGGLNTYAPTDAIADEQTVTLKNVLAKAGSLRCDTGYIAVGQVVSGQPQEAYQFKRKNFTTDELLLTTTTLYKWSTIFSRWHLIKGIASTTTTAGYAAGVTVIVVASATNFATGDLIAVTLDNADQLQTTVTVAGTTFTMADAVPVGRSIANGAAVIKSVVLTGSLDKQSSFDTIPANDWAVFTNGVDIVKRYDGTDCVDIPNLPSGGNTICRALVYYNTALFLLNTTEGGTSYPQRARRSDQTNPTNWTTGTAGFDNLLGTADIILSGMVLGPYLIVYRERSINRGSFIGSGGVNYQFEPTIITEGVLSPKSIVNMGDYHIFVGHVNVYEYRGGFNIQPIGDNIFFNLFGFSGDKDPAYDVRLFALYVEELGELWIAYVSGASATHICNKILRYNVKDKFWYSREFFDGLIGYGFFISEASLIWSALIGAWSSQAYTWDSRQILSNSPIVLLCSGITNRVYAYDYHTVLDNATSIAYTVETKDFAMGDGEFRFDKIEMMIQGTSVLFEYSTDAGLSWFTISTITQVVQDKVKVFKQLIAHKIRFRWTGSSGDFKLSWFGFSYKHESLY